MGGNNQGLCECTVTWITHSSTNYFQVNRCVVDSLCQIDIHRQFLCQAYTHLNNENTFISTFVIVLYFYFVCDRLAVVKKKCWKIERIKKKRTHHITSNVQHIHWLNSFHSNAIQPHFLFHSCVCWNIRNILTVVGSVTFMCFAYCARNDIRSLYISHWYTFRVMRHLHLIQKKIYRKTIIKRFLFLSLVKWVSTFFCFSRAHFFIFTNK